MSNAIAIAKKELNIYFATPIAYVMFTLFVVIGSYFFLRLLGAYEQASLAYMRFQSPEMMNRLNFQDAIFRNLFGNLGVILIFIIPFLTMRLVAEEKRQKTIELLYSTPVTAGEVVAGKYVAALAILVPWNRAQRRRVCFVDMFAHEPVPLHRFDQSFQFPHRDLRLQH